MCDCKEGRQEIEGGREEEEKPGRWRWIAKMSGGEEDEKGGIINQPSRPVREQRYQQQPCNATCHHFDSSFDVRACGGSPIVVLLSLL